MSVLLLAALGLGWHKRESLQGWLGQVPGMTSQARPGLMRKCVHGQQVSYTNSECPAGHREQALTAPPVNVLPATPVAKPADPGSSGPSSLHRALDLTPDSRLKDKLMERAIEGSR
ncbi:MAG TPA: hypothetical protein VGE36_03465 [Roseateles sp.]